MTFIITPVLQMRRLNKGGGVHLGSHSLWKEAGIGNLGLSSSEDCSFNPCYSASCEVNVTGEGGEPGRHFSSHPLSVWQEWLQITFLDSLPHPCSTPLRKRNAFWIGRFGRRYWVKVSSVPSLFLLGAQVLLLIRDLDLVPQFCLRMRGDSCLYESHSGSDIRGSFAHGHKMHTHVTSSLMEVIF